MKFKFQLLAEPIIFLKMDVVMFHAILNDSFQITLYFTLLVTFPIGCSNLI